MIRVQRAIIPGLLAGCAFLIFFTGLLTDPGKLMALTTRDGLAAASALSAGMSAAHLVEVSAPPSETTPTAQPTDPPAEIALDASSTQDGCLINASYPEKIQQWCALISRSARDYNVDPNLIAAVMLQESGGNSQAYSKSGAVGLLQVMPRDGLASGFMCQNGPCFASRPSMEELYDPAFNIDYGARMLAGLIQRTGSMRDALRSYGPMDMGYRYADIVLGHYQRYQ